jgi:alkaline phosphatase
MKKLLISTLLLTIWFLNIQSYAQKADSLKLKYVFLFIGDGMGLNQVFLTEKYLNYTKEDTLIFLNPLWKFGLAKTDCADSFKITDSGAAGTAIACGGKTHYGSIGVDTAYKQLTSMAEILHNKNFKIGIITSVPLNHATPACFYGHEPTRRNYDNLTNELIASQFDFFAGGGVLLGNADTSKKIYTNFDQVLLKMKENKYNLVLNTSGLNISSSVLPLPIIIMDTAIRNMQQKTKGLFTDEKNSLPFVIDHPELESKLADYTEAAIRCFQNDTTGFFIMVEGGEIDWACHDNDAATAVKEVIAFNDAIKKAYNFYLEHPQNTLIIVTADHETGGLTIGRGYDEYSKSSGNSYAFYPNKLVLQKNSLLLSDSSTVAKINYDAQVGWTSGEHTGLPVGVWSIGNGSRALTGIFENSDFKKKIQNQFGKKNSIKKITPK